MQAIKDVPMFSVWGRDRIPADCVARRRTHRGFDRVTLVDGGVVDTIAEGVAYFHSGPREWMPLVGYIRELAPEITSRICVPFRDEPDEAPFCWIPDDYEPANEALRLASWYLCDGLGLIDDDCTELAAALTDTITSGHARQHFEGDPTTSEALRAFRDFLRVCGGFRIW